LLAAEIEERERNTIERRIREAKSSQGSFTAAAYTSGGNTTSKTKSGFR
jgi:hypothetical protein